jgi:hypothetical protein
MSKTSIPCSFPCSVSGRSDHGQAEIRVSTPSRAAALATRRRLISAVSSGFSTPRLAPAPEQYDHWVTWSTSTKVSPGMARRISRGDCHFPSRLFSRQGSC